MSHASLTGLNLHQPFHYIQEGDPGAVGAGLFWFKKSSGALKYRNDANTAWVTVLASTFNYSGAPNMTILSAGTTWAQLLAAVAAASNGDTIMLPNETITQTSVLTIAKPLTIVGHPGGASKILAQADISEAGTTHQIAIGSRASPPSGINLANFAMEHDRVASPDMRTTAIDIWHGASNIDINNITFTDITSVCVQIRPWTDGLGEDGASNITVRNCTANEFWEAFFYAGPYGGCTNCWVFNNTGTVSNAHTGYQGPMGIEINIELTQGTISGVYAMNNSFVATNQTANGGCLGFVMNVNSPYSDCFYDKIFINQNTFNGFYYNVYIGAMEYQVTPTLTNFVEFSENQVLNSASYAFYVAADAANSENSDRLVVARNTFNGYGGSAQITYAAWVPAGFIANVIDIDNTWL